MAYNYKYYLGYGKSRAPLLLEDIKANATITIDIWMKDFGAEGDLKYHKLIIFKTCMQLYTDIYTKNYYEARSTPFSIFTQKINIRHPEHSKHNPQPHFGLRECELGNFITDAAVRG